MDHEQTVAEIKEGASSEKELENHYENLTIDSLLATGVSSEIYVARNKSSKKLTVKIFNNQSEKEYHNELKFLDKTDSTNIVKIFDHGKITDPKDTHYNHFYIVMEYAEKGDLVNYIESTEQIEEKEAKEIMLKVIDGVEDMHQIGFIHRDIKPENILMFNDGEIKITDFGFVEEMKKCSIEENGTPGYMAPEIVNHGKIVPEKIDVFSLGVVAFILVKGEFPFENPTDEDDCYKYVEEGNWEGYWNSVGSDVSDDFKEMIKGTLCADPCQRFSLKQLRNCTWIRGRKEF